MRKSERRADRRRHRAAARRRRHELRERTRESMERLYDRPTLKAHRDEQEKKRKRRRRRTLMLLMLILLVLLLIRCEVPQRGAGPAPAGTSEPAPTPEPPFESRLESQKRPGHSVSPRTGPTWIEDFRLQVGARSPRLAECFNGTERGGAFRWTTSVDAQTGAVASHDFEPLAGTTLTQKQKTCATQVLAHPGYKLKDPPSETLPNRVSLVLEF